MAGNPNIRYKLGFGPVPQRPAQRKQIQYNILGGLVKKHKSKTKFQQCIKSLTTVTSQGGKRQEVFSRYISIEVMIR